MKVGLEIHQQLNTKKLFCEDECELYDKGTFPTFRRKLHAVKGETGTVDIAASKEEQKERSCIYEITPNSCPVEWDEEPPHEMNGEAIRIALTVAKMVNAQIVDSVFVMRKVVIDGSNTAGFQRTALVATGGYITLDGKKIDIESVCLEEDASRKISENETEVVYRLDRLGIPLIEVATSPEINTAKEAREVAEYIGMIMRRAGKVRRGIGSIREDLNISITEGNRVEIKGIQDLSMLEKFVEEEVSRQERLIMVKKVIHERHADPDMKKVITDVTELFANCSSKVLSKAIAENGRILALSLPYFAGLLGDQLSRTRRVLGPEFASIARYHGARGIFHTDELPGYGIDEPELEKLYGALSLSRDNDAAVLFAGDQKKGERILGEIYERAIYAFTGVPKETRDPQPDGTSTYSRSLAGMHRMYPETDILPLKVEASDYSLPKMPDEVVNELTARFGIDRNFAWFIMKNGYDAEFVKMYEIAGDLSVIIKIFEETIPAMEKSGYHISDFSIFYEVLDAYRQRAFAREGITSIVTMMISQNMTVKNAIKKLGIAHGTREEVEKIIDKVVEDKIDFIKSVGRERAMQPLMGEVMKVLRGRYPGKEVQEILEATLSRWTS